MAGILTHSKGYSSFQLSDRTALPSLALKDTIYGLVLWNPHRQGLLTAEVPSEKEGMETVTRASPETETTPPSHSYAVSP